MTWIPIYGLGAAIIVVCMTVLWVVSLVLRDASIVDVFWGLGFVAVNWVYFVLSPQGLPARKWLVSSLVTIWGLRLSLYILWRNWGRPEDFRYRRWREDHGQRWWWRSLFQVFLLQGALMWVISVPLLAAQRGATERLTVPDLLAVLCWAVGFGFEAVGDYQMARFRSDPANRGQVLDRGLWRYTRHPNYFGDAVQWWAYWLFAAGVGGLWTVFSPLLMTWLLLRVSGVAMLERTLVETKPQYKAYAASTSAFFPWLPRRYK